MVAQRVAEAVGKAYGFAAEGATIEQVRSGYDASMGSASIPDGVRSSDGKVAGVAGRWFEVDGADTTVLYLHGGGYLFGSSRSHGPLAAHLASAANARVFVADYRLAPENPYPAALEDSSAVLDEFTSAPDSGRIVIAGDSAGGGLALATLLSARDEHIALPAAAVTFSAWSDLSLTGASIEERATLDPMVDRTQLENNAAAYLGDGDRTNPSVSPVLGEWGGLPPVYMQVGTEEILYDDTTRVVEKIRAAGGSAELVVEDGMPHVHQILLTDLPEAKASIAAAGAFIRALA